MIHDTLTYLRNFYWFVFCSPLQPFPSFIEQSLFILFAIPDPSFQTQLEIPIN